MECHKSMNNSLTGDMLNTPQKTKNVYLSDDILHVSDRCSWKLCNFDVVAVIFFIPLCSVFFKAIFSLIHVSDYNYFLIVKPIDVKLMKSA